MRALIQDRYVSAEGAVHIDDVGVPDVGDDEVLVRVRAASANPKEDGAGESRQDG